MTAICLRDIDNAVSRAFSVHRRELAGDGRKQIFSQARMAAYHLARLYTDNSLPRIARHYGGRDHTTVMHGLSRYAVLRNDHVWVEKLNHAHVILQSDARRYLDLVQEETRKLLLSEEQAPPPAASPADLALAANEICNRVAL